jgi:hypothetical protein
VGEARNSLSSHLQTKEILALKRIVKYFSPYPKESLLGEQDLRARGEKHVYKLRARCAAQGGVGGFIWVYLRDKSTHGKQQFGSNTLSGSAWDSSAHCATTQRWAGGIGAPSALVDECEADTSSGERGAFLPASAAKAVSSDAVADRAQQAHTAQLVCRVTAPECKIYGAVYRISVACARDSPAPDVKNNDNHTSRDRGGDKASDPALSRGSQHAPLGHVPLQRAYSDPTHCAPLQTSGCPGDECSSLDEAYDRPDLEYVVVSWVYDVKETAVSAVQGRV